MAETDSRADAVLRARRTKGTPSNLTPGTARRQRFPARRPGSGRVTTPRAIELRGRRTGWKAKETVLRDADGLDNIDDFFGDDEPVKAKAPTPSPADSPMDADFGDDDMAPEFELSPPMSGPRSVRRSPASASAEKETEKENGGRPARRRSARTALAALPSPETPAAAPKTKGKGKKRAAGSGSASKSKRPRTPETPDDVPMSPVDTPATLRTLTPSTTQSLPAGDSTFVADSSDEEAESDAEPLGDPTPTPAPKKRSRGGALVDDVRTPRVVLTYSDDEDDEAADGDDGAQPVRRSRRQRIAPLAFWKNESVEYTRSGDAMAQVLPVISKVIRKETPADKRRERQQQARKRSQAAKKSMAKLRSGALQPALADKHLPEGRAAQFDDGAVARVSTQQGVADARVLAREADLVMGALPVAAERPANRRAATVACKTFTDHGNWISGFLEVPPRGMKDAETVGECTQVFCVVRAQPGALELAMLAGGAEGEEEDGEQDEQWQRFRVNAGDTFYLPPDNVYQLENHSPDTPARLHYMILQQQ